jgi:hypothetical protein
MWNGTGVNVTTNNRALAQPNGWRPAEIGR